MHSAPPITGRKCTPHGLALLILALVAGCSSDQDSTSSMPAATGDVLDADSPASASTTSAASRVEDTLEARYVIGPRSARQMDYRIEGQE